MMDIIVYIFSLLSLCLLFGIFYLQRSVLIFIPIVLGVLYYFPAFFDVIYGNYLYNSSVVRDANLFALYVNFNLFFISFFVYRIIGGKKKLVDIPNLNEGVGVVRFFLVIQIISLIFLLYAVYVATNGNILSYSWATKHESGGGGVGFLISSYLFIVSSGVLFLSWYFNYKKVFLLSICLVIFYIILIRSRGFIVPVLMVFGFYYLVWRGKILGSFLFGFLFLILFFFLQQIRYLGELNNIQDMRVDVMVGNIIDKIMSEDSEFSLRNSYYFFVQNYDYLVESSGFGNFQTYRRLGFFFDIFNLGLKPKDFTNTMYIAYYGGNSSLSNPTLHPTMYGNIYANGLYISSLIFTFLFSILIFVENALKRKGFLIYWLVAPTFLYSCIFIARGSIYNAILILMINILLVFLFTSIKKTKLL
ncbi:O-antigen polymerase [Acinetobacter haemolyticus]|uniref:O-antigen polymerase n=1 Tax=Acinetobacter haemolyticus TaxID=29430 RepID=UPI0013735CCB|nr:O-antigen polymerase [Acinetobacter haemolyticus]NAS07489.1 hypothetical protein [Acinetobacter haemolyticus]